MSAFAGALEQRLGSLTLPLAVVLPGGRRLGPSQAVVTLRLNDLAPIGHLVTGQIGKVGQDYVEGRMEFDGGVRELIALAAELMPGDPTTAEVAAPPLSWLRHFAQIAKSRSRHQIETDARQVQFHYDVSDDFYGLWLDPKRVYSCAYFRDAGMSVAAAQEAKLEHICAKLMLRPGERFLDIGAGLEAVDVESLRPHYAKTLWAWSDALEAQLDAARALTSDTVVRAYRLYLAGSAMCFERAWLSLYQMLCARRSGSLATGPMRGAQSAYPFNRGYMYPPR